MDLEDQFRQYFGTVDLDRITPDGLAAGSERLRVDFGLEIDRNQRFALWAMMPMLGIAPDLDIAFASEDGRNASRSFMDITD